MNTNTNENNELTPLITQPAAVTRRSFIKRTASAAMVATFALGAFATEGDGTLPRSQYILETTDFADALYVENGDVNAKPTTWKPEPDTANIDYPWVHQTASEFGIVTGPGIEGQTKFQEKYEQSFEQTLPMVANYVSPNPNPVSYSIYGSTEYKIDVRYRATNEFTTAQAPGHRADVGDPPPEKPWGVYSLKFSYTWEIELTVTSTTTWFVYPAKVTLPGTPFERYDPDFSTHTTEETENAPEIFSMGTATVEVSIDKYTGVILAQVDPESYVLQSETVIFSGTDGRPDQLGLRVQGKGDGELCYIGIEIFIFDHDQVGFETLDWDQFDGGLIFSSGGLTTDSTPFYYKPYNYFIYIV